MHNEQSRGISFTECCLIVRQVCMYCFKYAGNTAPYPHRLCTLAARLLYSMRTLMRRRCATLTCWRPHPSPPIITMKTAVTSGSISNVCGCGVGWIHWIDEGADHGRSWDQSVGEFSRIPVNSSPQSPHLTHCVTNQFSVTLRCRTAALRW